jgi:membrane protease YdiL (CAAX protease family)
MSATLPPPPQRTLLARIFISPAEPRLRAGWRILGQLILLSVLTIIFILLMSPLAIVGVKVPGGELVMAQIASVISMTLAVYLARRYLDRRPFSSLGFMLGRRTWMDLLAGFLIAGVAMLSIYALERLLGWLTVQSVAWNGQSMVNILAGLLAMLIFQITVGWQEELYSRGYLLQNISDGLNTAWGVILSSGIFALLHLANPNVTFMSVVGVFLAGLFLAFGYLRTRQLWLPIGLHIGWNFFEGTMLGFPVSGITLYRLIDQTVNAPQLLGGGAFGPEAGLIVLPGLAIGAFLIYWYTRSSAKPKV